LKIIGSPVLEGEKEHLENLMQVILQYSRSYISGIRKTYTSNKKIVTISPIGINHKLCLNSTKQGIKPLEIILDDAELSDLTRCFDLLRFDTRFNVNWNIGLEIPFTKKYILSNLNKQKNNLNILYSIIIFIIVSTFLLFIPINNRLDIEEKDNKYEPFKEELNINK
jgi:hypothetical protein